MAEFGIKATQMSGADTKAAKHVRQPVEDQSSVIKLKGIGEAIGMATNFAEGVWDRSNVKTLASDITGVADEFTSRQEAPSKLAEAKAQEDALTRMWDTTTEEELGKMAPKDFWSGTEEIGKVQTSIDSTLEKYKNAYSQGRMSSDELITRVNSATKAAIARQPGLARELVSQAAFYQNLSGVTDHIAASQAFEKDQRKAEQDGINDENKMLIKWGHNPNTLAPQQRAQVVEEAFKQEQNVQKMDAVKKQMEVLASKGQLDERMVDQVFTSPDHVKVLNSDLLQSSNSINTSLESKAYEGKYPGMAPADARLRGIGEEFAAKRNWLTSQAARGSDKAKRVAEAQIKQYDEMEKLYKDIALGGPTATASKQALEARKATLGMSTASLEHQLSLANQWASVMGNLGPLAMQYSDPTAARTLLDQTNQSLSNFMNGYGPPPTATLDLTNRDGQTQAKLIFTSQNPVGDPLRQPAEVVVANDRNMSSTLKMMKATEDPVKFMQAMDVWTQTVVQEALSSDKPISTRYSPAVVAEANKFLADSFANAKTSGTLSYDKAGNSFKVLNPDGTANVDRTKRINTYFKAFLSFNGRKTDERIDEAGELLGAMANLKPAEATLRDKSKGPVNLKGGLTPEQLKYIDKSGQPASVKDAMKIPPEVQQERDKTRLRILRTEINDFSKQLQTETDPAKRKILEDNIGFVTKELSNLEKGK